MNALYGFKVIFRTKFFAILKILKQLRGLNWGKLSIRILALAISTCILLSSGLVAREYEIRFQRLTIEDGLSQSTIFNIFQDNQGFMWFGTEDGLNKFNGYGFKIYKNSPKNPNSLSYNYVKGILQDQTGALWIGTYGGGLNKLDLEKEQFICYTNSPGDVTTLSNDFINCLYEDQAGTLWVGTDDGLNRFNSTTGKFVRFFSDPNNRGSLSNDKITSILRDRSGMLWIGTYGGGLNRFDPNKKQFTSFKHDPKNPKSLSYDVVKCLYEDQKGVLWVGTENGLNTFDKETGQFFHYKNNPSDPQSLSNNYISAIYESRLGDVWIGTQNGLNKFNRGKGTFVRFYHEANDPTSLVNNEVFSINEDRSGVLWIGTHVGLSKYDQGKKQFVHYKKNLNESQGLIDNYVRAIYEDPSGILWIGSYGGLTRLDREQDKYTHYRNNSGDPGSLSSNRVMSICEDEVGTLWIGTYGGLNKFRREEGRFIHFHSSPDNPASLSSDLVRVVHLDRSGALWIGTENGLNKFDRQTGKFLRYLNNSHDPQSLSNNFIYAISEDKSGALWIGTLDGLNRFDRQSGKFKCYRYNSKDPRSISNREVLSIYEDQSGVLWVGTLSGLNKFDRESETFTYYLEKDGLPNDLIYDILEDSHGNLWLSTNRGLSKFNPVSEKFRNYDVNDGLQSNEFTLSACFKSTKGEMFFGGVSGFNAFFPDQIIDNRFVPPIVITDLQIANKSVPIGEGAEGRTVLTKSITETTDIKVTYQDRVITFEFAALHFAAPAKNSYAYIMEGFEKVWNEVGNRRLATYTNLRPGRYVFRVKGSNNDGVWNKRGAAIRIQVTPPFWLTPWFRSLAIIFSLAMVFIVYRARTKAIRERNKRLEIHVEERTSELRRANLKLQDEIEFRIQMENELKRLKEFNESIVQNMAEGIVVQDVNGYHTFVNPSTAALLEYKPEEIIGLHWKNIVPLDQHHIVEEADKLRAKKQASRYEVELISKSGKRISIQISGNPIFNDGNFVGSVAVFTDISEIKRVEEEKRHREAQNALIYKVGQRVGSKIELKELLSEIVTSIRDAFSYYGVMLLLLDEAGKNLHLQSITGGYAKIYSGDQKVEVGSGMIGYAAASGEIQASGDVSQNPHYCRWENEETKSELSVPIKSGDKVIGVLDIQSDDCNAFDEIDVRAMRTLATQIASAIDNARLYERAQKEIAERKRAEEALKIEKSYLDQLFDSAQEAIVVTETNGRVLRLNPEFTKLFGYTPDEALGRLIDDLVAPEDYYKSASAITKKAESGGKVGLETVRRRKDGTLAHVILLVSPIVIDGKVEATYAIYRDISLRIRAEEKLKQTAEELMRSNKELELFAYIASHDLQEPLRMVASYVQLLERRYKGKLDSDAEEFIGYAVDGASRMQRMINDLLIYSRVGTKGKPFTPIEVEKVLEQATSNLQIAIEESKAVVTHDPLPLLLGDETQLVQLFQNLIGNAIKFRENHQEPYIYVSAEEKPDEWLFLVRDNGIGIDPQYYERIFQIFQRLHGHKDYPGSGIGLAVCRRIVERHGGRIWVDSQPGKGSTFYFTIPKRSEKR
jgi:PAS domain S-box-containing protein